MIETKDFEFSAKGKVALNNHGLSQREKEIALHLIDSTSHKEVADRLGLTVSGVKFHNTNIYRKLKVSTKYGFLMKMFKFIRVKE